MHKDYFEAILQLRNPSKPAQDFALKALGDSIGKIKKVRNGYDIFVQNKKIAERAGRQVRDEFGGDFNIAPRIFSRDPQTSKELYRLNILVRFPGYQKKDVLKVDNVLLLVTGLGKKLTGKNLMTGKKIIMNYPDKYELLEKHNTRVVKVKPEVEVLHPENYQAMPLQNKPQKELVIDEKVKVVIDNGAYII
ncbi:NMD3-related protein [Nanoarchaeota archaeon]